MLMTIQLLLPVLNFVAENTAKRVTETATTEKPAISTVAEADRHLRGDTGTWNEPL